MGDDESVKASLQRYLQETRDALLWKLDGLGERELRLPRTPTGTNFLGMVLHCANVELGYLGEVFGRPWPDRTSPCYVAEDAYAADPQADWWVDGDVSSDEVVAFYRDVWAFADETIRMLPLDAAGEVPWWPSGRREVTLHRAIVHVLTDLARHAGQADVLREAVDGTTGLRRVGTNMPDGFDWTQYTARLRALAEQFPTGDAPG